MIPALEEKYEAFIHCCISIISTGILQGSCIWPYMSLMNLILDDLVLEVEMVFWR